MIYRLTEGYFNSFDGTKIYYNYAGKGTSLICCDGIACDMYAWKYIFEHFVKEYKIVRWNYRGHGRSEKPTDFGNLRIEDLVEDLRILMDTIRVKKAVLLGHSMGTQVILEFWHKYPDRVIGLIPICGSFEYPLRTFHNSDILEKTVPYLARLYERHEALFRTIWYQILPTKFSFWLSVLVEINYFLVKMEDFMPYLEHLAKMDLRLFFTMLQNANKHSARDYLREINVPVLIFGGEKDKFTPLWLSKQMHNMIPTSELQILPLGTHTSPIEHPDLICLRIEKFLKEKIGKKVKRVAKKEKKTSIDTPASGNE
ncbi:MAG: alpha/beta hydrolase [Deltaproteobacteria bacterium]|nr:alpha/beta hydrolase [Deltaproteobacteria bacterium]